MGLRVIGEWGLVSLYAIISLRLNKERIHCTVCNLTNDSE